MTASSRERAALGVGLFIGVLFSAVAWMPDGALDGTGLTRPSSVPSTATWSDDVLGGPHWFECTGGGAELDCKAYSPQGVVVMSARYAAAGGQSLSSGPPFTDVVAPRVDKIWINKTPFVPAGRVEFPVSRTSVDYVKGKRTSEPGS